MVSFFFGLALQYNFLIGDTWTSEDTQEIQMALRVSEISGLEETRIAY